MTKREVTFEEVSKPLIAKGYPAGDVLPIIPPDAKLDERSSIQATSLGKIPGAYVPGGDLATGLGTWVGLKWQNGFSEANQVAARDWPTGNVGLRAENFPGLDLDVNTEEALVAVKGVVESTLSLAGPIRTRAGAPRCLIPYRLEGEPFGKLRTEFRDSDGVNHAVELLARGQQYVVAGVHPKGMTYEWTKGGLVGCSPSKLPGISKSDAHEFFSLLGEEIETRGWTLTKRAGTANSALGQGVPLSEIDPPYPPAVAVVALRSMPNTEENFPTRDDLISVTAEFKAALGHHAETHRADYLKWAEDGDYPDCDFEGIWDSLHAVRKDTEALYRRARAYGFYGDALEDFRGEPPQVPSNFNTHSVDDGKGKGPTNLDAIARKLAEDPEWRDVLGYDEFKQREMVLKHLPDPERPNYRPNEPFTPRPLTDSDVTQTLLWLQRVGKLPAAKKSDVQEAIGWRARCNRYHPARDYLDGLIWDDIPRLGTWLVDHLGAKADVSAELEATYLSEVGTKFLIGGVARIYEPGCKLDTVLVLEGEQGVGKSSLVRALVPNADWHSDTPPEMGTNDARLHLQGKWIVELPELASVTRAGVEHVKAFITAPVDKFRRPYGRMDESYPRQCVFVGTANPLEFLRDDTGGRRFWPVRMTKHFDGAAFCEVRDQLWAEAKAKYREGEPWHLTGAALGAAKEAQAAKAETDPWEEAVVSKAKELAEEGQWPPTAAELLEQGVGVMRQNMNRAHQNRVAGCLKRAGWRQDRQRINGRPVRFWWHDDLGKPPLKAWEDKQRMGTEQLKSESGIEANEVRP